jgi:AraC family transcriptional activator of pyochelin receptor
MTYKKISTQDLTELFSSMSGTHSNLLRSYAATPCFERDFAVYKPGFGHFSGSATILPGLRLHLLEMAPEDDLLLTDYTPSDTIDLNFQLKGAMYSGFNNVRTPLNMTQGTHNLLFAPFSNSLHKIAKTSGAYNLHLSMDNEYFLKMLGNPDKLTEGWLLSIEHMRSFTGAPHPQVITTDILRVINDIIACRWTGVMRKLYIESKVMEIVALQIGQFSTRSTIPAVETNDLEKLRALKELLDANFLDEYTLYDLVKATTLNEFKIKSGFKKLYNISVFGYLKQLRMQHAYQLLADHSYTVEEVSEVLGYNHSHHFSAAFKKHFGKTPSSVKV